MKYHILMVTILHGLIFGSVSNAETESCLEQSEDQEILSCLNRKALNIFHSGGANSLESQFYIDFLALAESQRLEISSAPESLSRSFSIEIPRTKDLLSINSPSCFNFEPSWSDWALGQSKQNRVELVMGQMNQVALFLKHIHLLSLGQDNSFIFPLRRIEICGGDELNHNYNQGILRLQISLSSASTYSARELFEMWSSGDLVFGKKPGLIERTQRYLNKDAAAVLSEKFRSFWPLINPTGDLRFRLRVLLHNYLHHLQIDVKSKDLESLAPSRQENFELRNVSMTQEESALLKSKWLQNLQNPQLVSQLTEQAILQTQMPITQITNIDHRRNIGLINVKNNKQINIDIQGLFTEVYLFEAPSQERRIESHSLQVGLVNIDLIDQVSVDLSLPQGIPQWIERTTFKKAVQDLGL